MRRGMPYDAVVDRQPGFDRDWLAALSRAATEAGHHSVQLEDLYLERRLERRLDLNRGVVDGAEVREEGCALRWRLGTRWLLSCENGLSPAALRRAAEPGRGALRVPDARPRIEPDIVVPEAWPAWAERTAAGFGPHSGTVRYLERRAAVVTRDGWREVHTPGLCLVHVDGPRAVSVLAVWGRDELDRWVSAALDGTEGTWAPPAGRRTPVVFADGSGGAIIHEIVGHLSESDLLQDGASPLLGLAGERLAPESLTVVDDPCRHDLPGGFDVDDEGVPAEPRTLLGHGRSVGWLCDLSGAAALARPAGRGRRAAWQVPPVARMSNLTVAPGDHSPANIEASVDRGLVATRVGAATVDPRAERVVLRVDRGWELVRGRRRRPLLPFFLHAPAPAILGRIAPELGDDPTPDRHLGWCGKAGHTLPTGCETPTLLVDGLEVLGEA